MAKNIADDIKKRAGDKSTGNCGKVVVNAIDAALGNYITISSIRFFCYIREFFNNSKV